MILTSKYLASNLSLASSLRGEKVQCIARLMDLEPEDELRIESGPIILETQNKIRLYITVDEGMGNLILFDASAPTEPISQKINEFTYKYLIFQQGDVQGKLTSLLEYPITNVEIISRPYENYGFFSMCGFRLTFMNGQSLCIGTYLTDLRILDIWILMPEEVDTNLHYQPLASASE